MLFAATELRDPCTRLIEAGRRTWQNGGGLDDARTPPDRMPEPLRRTLAVSDPAQVPAWAGFVHSGQ